MSNPFSFVVNMLIHLDRKGVGGLTNILFATRPLKQEKYVPSPTSNQMLDQICSLGDRGCKRTSFLPIAYITPADRTFLTVVIT